MIAALGSILVVMVLVAAVLSLKRSEWALVLLVGLFAIEQVLQSYYPALIARSSLFNIFIGSVVLVAVLGRIARQQNVFGSVMNAVTWCLLGFYALQAFAYLWTPSKEYIQDSFAFNWPYMVTLLGLAPLLVSSVREYRRFIIAFLIVGAVVAMMIMVNPRAEFTGGRLRLELGAYSGQQAGNPLAVASLGGMLVIVASLIQFERGAKLLLLLRIAGLMGGLGIAILSGSRGQVLFALMTIVVFYPVSRQVKDLRQFFLVCFGGGFILIVALLTFKVFLGAENEERWSVESLQAGADDRLGLIIPAMEAFLDSPQSWLFGMGPGAFDSLGTKASYVHNVVVEVLTELGVAGLCVFGLMYVMLFRQGRSLFETFRDDPRYRSSVAILFAMVFFHTMLGMKQGSVMASPAFFAYLLICARISMVDDTYEQEAAEGLFDHEWDAYADAEDEDWGETSGTDPETGLAYA